MYISHTYWPIQAGTICRRKEWFALSLRILRALYSSKLWVYKFNFYPRNPSSPSVGKIGVPVVCVINCSSFQSGYSDRKKEVTGPLPEVWTPLNFRYFNSVDLP